MRLSIAFVSALALALVACGGVGIEPPRSARRAVRGMPPLAKRSGVHAAPAPEQFSATSHGPTAGRHGVTVPSDRSSSPVAADVGGYTDIVQVATGESHTCVVRSGGSVICWGRDSYGGELGDGLTVDRRSPGPVSSVAGVTWLVAGSDHTCGLEPAGVVACWGWNGMGQLGDGTNTDRYMAVTVHGL